MPVTLAFEQLPLNYDLLQIIAELEELNLSQPSKARQKPTDWPPHSLGKVRAEASRQLGRAETSRPRPSAPGSTTRLVRVRQSERPEVAEVHNGEKVRASLAARIRILCGRGAGRDITVRVTEMPLDEQVKMVNDPDYLKKQLTERFGALHLG